MVCKHCGRRIRDNPGSLKKQHPYWHNDSQGVSIYCIGDKDTYAEPHPKEHNIINLLKQIDEL